MTFSKQKIDGYYDRWDWEIRHKKVQRFDAETRKLIQEGRLFPHPPIKVDDGEDYHWMYKLFLHFDKHNFFAKKGYMCPWYFVDPILSDYPAESASPIQ